MKPIGTVYLVGAGPGDPELITVKGLKCLRGAGVVLYDRLIHPDLLHEAPSWAERIYVGKGTRHHSVPQDGINTLLVKKALSGQDVVRLKGGDPFVFGRGGEEFLACQNAGVPCTVVPGISSAIAAPAAAGIPLTYRGVAGSFAVITGHRQPGELEVDWSGLSGVDTLVILMGVERLPIIVEHLLDHGYQERTPVAIIERGTFPDQQVITSCLAEIVSKADVLDVRPPATIVVGDVVNFLNGAVASEFSYQIGEPSARASGREYV